MTKLTRSILRNRGVAGFERNTRRPLTVDETPSNFRKTPLMRYLEAKYSKPISSIVADGNIYEVARKYGIDYSTVSKWRKIIMEADYD